MSFDPVTYAAVKKIGDPVGSIRESAVRPGPEWAEADGSLKSKAEFPLLAAIYEETSASLVAEMAPIMPSTVISAASYGLRVGNLGFANLGSFWAFTDFRTSTFFSGSSFVRVVGYPSRGAILVQTANNGTSYFCKGDPANALALDLTSFPGLDGTARTHMAVDYCEVADVLYVAVAGTAGTDLYVLNPTTGAVLRSRNVVKPQTTAVVTLAADRVTGQLFVAANVVANSTLRIFTFTDAGATAGPVFERTTATTLTSDAGADAISGTLVVTGAISTRLEVASGVFTTWSVPVATRTVRISADRTQVYLCGSGNATYVNYSWNYALGATITLTNQNTAAAGGSTQMTGACGSYIWLTSTNACGWADADAKPQSTVQQTACFGYVHPGRYWASQFDLQVRQFGSAVTESTSAIPGLNVHGSNIYIPAGFICDDARNRMVVQGYSAVYTPDSTGRIVAAEAGANSARWNHSGYTIPSVNTIMKVPGSAKFVAVDGNGFIRVLSNPVGAQDYAISDRYYSASMAWDYVRDGLVVAGLREIGTTDYAGIYFLSRGALETGQQGVTTHTSTQISAAFGTSVTIPGIATLNGVTLALKGTGEVLRLAQGKAVEASVTADWTLDTSFRSGGVKGLYSTQNAFYAFTSSTILRSTNGELWAPAVIQDLNAGGAYAIERVLFDNVQNVHVAIGDNFLAFSLDGLTFTRVSLAALPADRRHIVFAYRDAADGRLAVLPNGGAPAGQVSVRGARAVPNPAGPVPTFRMPMIVAPNAIAKMKTWMKMG